MQWCMDVKRAAYSQGTRLRHKDALCIEVIVRIVSGQRLCKRPTPKVAERRDPVERLHSLGGWVGQPAEQLGCYLLPTVSKLSYTTLFHVASPRASPKPVLDR